MDIVSGVGAGGLNAPAEESEVSGIEESGGQGYEHPGQHLGRPESVQRFIGELCFLVWSALDGIYGLHFATALGRYETMFSCPFPQVGRHLCLLISLAWLVQLIPVCLALIHFLKRSSRRFYISGLQSQP
jgi:hypothetical protein